MWCAWLQSEVNEVSRHHVPSARVPRPNVPLPVPDVKSVQVDAAVPTADGVVDRLAWPRSS